MKHPSIRQLFDHWNARRGRRAVPERGDIEPSAIRDVLADTFILSFQPYTGHPFRVAGTRVCALFGRELKGEAFIGLWSNPARGEIHDLIAIMANETVGIVASAAHSSAAHGGLMLELLLLPVGYPTHKDGRLLGAIVPSGSAADGAMLRPVRELALGTHRYVGTPSSPPPIAFPAVRRNLSGRIRHGFMVYDGGRC